ncbi:Pr6Pr family membrane protein [Microlunatus flavus]|uniref:FAR-17a/AIG1-like protein n=1 Tax=Microlunatus flavus TaxID=1036181 RepID=A0A1H9H445_9ACTN|nr:Pr6Pr family membrane protein [Microlunatus flavus]SEQ57096.1 hypothetical protein SAMN05421756_104115 [Microlunatus flavus]
MLHAAVALVVLVSLVVQLALLLFGGTDTNTGDSLAGVPLSRRLGDFVSYFTIQSNLFVLAISLTLALDPERDGPVWRVLRLDALLGISITGLVYWALLAPLVDLSGWGLVAGLGFHLVSPVGTVVVWFLVGPRPRITWSTVAWAFAWPVAWVVYTFVRGAVIGWYPYPFLDVTEVGYATALLAVGGVLVLGVLLLLLFRWLDGRLRPAPRGRGGSR